MVMSFKTGASYLALFPGLGLFYFGLMLIGQINFGAFELEGLRPFGGPSLSNLVEIPIATALGGIAAVVLYSGRSRGAFQSDRSLVRFVVCAFGVAVAFYFLMPTLLE